MEVCGPGWPGVVVVGPVTGAVGVVDGPTSLAVVVVPTSLASVVVPTSLAVVVGGCWDKMFDMISAFLLTMPGWSVRAVRASLTAGEDSDGGPKSDFAA